MKTKNIEQRLRQEKDKIGLVGTSLSVSETQGNSISADISLDFRKINLRYGTDLELVPDSQTQSFVRKKRIQEPELKLGLDLTHHECGHRENPVDTKQGCPYTIEMHDAIKEAVFKRLQAKAKQGLTTYVTNAFEDFLDNVSCRRQTDFAGQTLFWNNQGLVNSQSGKFSKFYEAFVRMNLMTGSEVASADLLRRFFTDDEKVKNASRGFLADLKSQLGLERTVRLHEKPEFQKLFTTDLDERQKLWTRLAESFAEHTADLLDNVPKEKLFGSSENDDENSDEHNPFDRQMRQPSESQGVALKRYNGKKGLAPHRDRKEQLYDFYRAISREIKVQCSTYSASQKMPLVRFGKRDFDPETDRKLIFRGIKPNPQGVTLRTARHSIDFPVAYKRHKTNFPRFKMVLMDRSGSMGLNPDNTEEVGDKSFVPWGDKSKYHFALKGKFGIDNYLERQGIARYVKACALGWSGEQAVKGDYREVAKSLLEVPSGVTSFDIDGLEKELEDQALVLSLSDGECNLTEETKSRLEKKLSECDFAHIQVGAPTEFSKYLESQSVPVFYVKGDDDLSKTMIDFVSGYYKSRGKLK